MKVQFKMKSANMELSGTATQDASFWHGAVIGFSTMFKATGGESATCSLDLTVDDEALEGSLDEVLSEFQHRIGDAMIVERAAGRETLQKGKSSEQASATNPASEET